MSSTPIRIDDDRLEEVDQVAEQQGIKRATALDLVLAAGLRALEPPKRDGRPISDRARAQFAP